MCRREQALNRRKRSGVLQWFRNYEQRGCAGPGASWSGAATIHRKQILIHVSLAFFQLLFQAAEDKKKRGSVNNLSLNYTLKD